MTQTPTPTPTPLDAMDPVDRALVEEAAKKSGLVWVQRLRAAPARALWHVWHEGAAHASSGTAPASSRCRGSGSWTAAPPTVTVRSKDKGGRLVGLDRRGWSNSRPGGEAWDRGRRRAEGQAAERGRTADAIDGAVGPGVPGAAAGAGA